MFQQSSSSPGRFLGERRLDARELQGLPSTVTTEPRVNGAPLDRPEDPALNPGIQSWSRKGRWRSRPTPEEVLERIQGIHEAHELVLRGVSGNGAAERSPPGLQLFFLAKIGTVQRKAAFTLPKGV